MTDETGFIEVPKVKGCFVCKHCARIEEVTSRLITLDGQLRPPKDAVDYLRSVGLAGTDGTMRQRAVRHAKHVLLFLQKPYVMAPIADKIELPPEPHWLDANTEAIKVGMEAQKVAGERLQSGWMEDKDVIALAKLGLAASTARGGFEARGRVGNTMNEILRALAGGGPKQLDDGNTISGEFEEIE